MRVIVDSMVWVPESEFTAVQIENLERELTVYPAKTTNLGSKGNPPPIKLFRRSGRYFGIPRGFYIKRRTVEHDVVVKVSYGELLSESIKSLWRAHGQFEEQATIIDVLLKRCMENGFMERGCSSGWGGFILKAGCGTGKTNVALELAYRLGYRTCILVHKEFFLKQWLQRIREFYPGARVGFIRQDSCSYKDKDFVIAMLQSLAKDEDGRRYPQEIYSAFGTVISDETHRISAQTWAPVISRFKAAWRIGLTATPRRLDRSEDVFFYHIGDIAYSAKTRAIIPKLRIIYTDFVPHPISRGKYKVSVDNLNSAQLATQIGKNQFRNRQVVEDIIGALKVGRKVMIVSERLEQLKLMANDLNNLLMKIDLGFIPIVDFYVGDWFTGEVDKRGKPKKKRRTEEELNEAIRANVIFATKQMVEEGLDIPALDVIVLATPIGDVEQVVGRVRRWCYPDKEVYGVYDSGVSLKCLKYCKWRAGKCNGKPQPIVVDVVDRNVDYALRKFRSRERFYRKIGCK